MYNDNLFISFIFSLDIFYLCQGHVDKRGFATSPLSK